MHCWDGASLPQSDGEHVITLLFTQVWICQGFNRLREIQTFLIQDHSRHVSDCAWNRWLRQRFLTWWLREQPVPPHTAFFVCPLYSLAGVIGAPNQVARFLLGHEWSHTRRVWTWYLPKSAFQLDVVWKHIAHALIEEGGQTSFQVSTARSKNGTTATSVDAAISIATLRSNINAYYRSVPFLRLEVH